MEPGHQQEDSRIVVGVDGSEQSQLALRWAAQLARSLGGRIQAVMAWQFPAAHAFVVVKGWDPERDAHSSLRATVDAAFGDDRPPELQLLVQQGMPAKVLIDASAGARMLVVGNRGRGGFAGLLLGSVSSAVAEHAHCPVLVIHPSAQPDPVTAAPATH